MKLFALFLCFSLSIFSQDFTTIKTKTDAYSGLLTAEKLAQNIARDFSSDEDKAKALFCWLTKNIRYDLEEFYNTSNRRTSFRYRTIEEKNEIIQGIKDKSVSETLSNRKAICEGYAQTFSKVCNLLTIENEVIRGYVRASPHQIGTPLQEPNHAWNAVKINDNWVYIDATWGAGHEDNGKWYRKFKPYYFNMKKDTYFKTHLPEESVWRLRVARMDKVSFYNQPLYSYNFLSTNYELAQKLPGFLKKDKNGKIHIPLKNVATTQKMHFGFLGEQFAKKATINSINGTTVASITAPTNAKQVSLLIDLYVMVTFKIL